MKPDKIGRYSVIREIDRGGMATVYLAIDPRFNREVAIKVLPRQFTHDPAFQERFLREARTIAKLEHSSIVPVYDFGETDGQPYLVMRYMSGGTLANRLGEGPMGLEESVVILQRVAAALDEAHSSGIIHRDLKPANILFDKSGEAYLSDFGIAKVSEASAALTGSSIIGTPAYMSPEQAQGGEQLTPASDVYTLTVIFFEMLTGQQPYKADTPMGVAMKHIMDPIPSILALKSELGPDVEKLMQKGLAKKPKDRYQSAGEFSKAITSLFETGKFEKPQVDDSPTISPDSMAAPTRRSIPRLKTPLPVSQPSEGITPSEKKPPSAISQTIKRKRGPWITCGIILAVIICSVTVFASGGFATIMALVGLGSATETPVVEDTASDPIPFGAVVQIWAMFDDGSSMQVGWTGSGSIISPDGMILTNAHVVLPDRYFPVDALIVAMTVDEDKPPEPAYYAKVLQADESLDIAVIRIFKDMDNNPVDYTKVNLPYVPLGDSDALKLGDPVTIIGYPGIGGQTITLTRGDISGFTAETGRGERAFIKTSATIAGGNSGGLAADQNGYLIGIPTQLGYGGDDQFVDCRVLVDTNRDGRVDENDSCVPTGGFINALRPVKLAIPLIEAARRGEVWIGNSSKTSDDALPTGGSVLFQDDFSSASSGWDTGTSENGSVSYSNGVYKISVTSIDYVIWGNAYQNFSDTVITVDARVLSATGEGDFGFMCRYQDNGNFYALELSEDGYYAIWKYQGGEFYALVEWTPSASVPVGSNWMNIKAACVGNTLSLAVNDVFLVEVQDNSFSSGDIALMAGTWTKAGLVLEFDNLVVQSP
jgi:serine/threonine-protein kinase